MAPGGGVLALQSLASEGAAKAAQQDATQPPALLELLGDSPILDLDVIQALGRVGRRPQHVVPALVNCLDHDSVYCRTNAEGALLRFGKVAIPMLEKAASSEHFVRARRARRLLRKIRVK